MTTPAANIIRRAADILKDATGIRWPADELVRWLNDGQLEVARQRPDQVAQIVPTGLVAGFRQTLPASALKLIDIPCNSAAPKAAIRQVDRKDMDVLDPAWRAATASAVVKHFIYDDRTPLLFEVWPPATVAAQVDLCVAVRPVDVAVPSTADYASVTGSIGVPDLWANALVDYVLYRAFSKDSETTANAARAAGCWQAFGSAIGADLTAQATVSPKSRTPGMAAQ